MGPGYDEWAAARTPSLLAFAAALVDRPVDPGAADKAVAAALMRVRTVWPQVSRDDPDLQARRHVVRACSRPRRAAVVLRLLEHRSDAEIAEVLGCSESAVRRHLARGLHAAETDGPDLHRQVVERAGAAPTQLLVRPAPPSTEAVGRPRGALLTAVAVVALLGGVAYTAHQSTTPVGVIRYPAVHAPESWRVESYAGVQLEVPDTWGWGASPLRSSWFAGPSHLGSCGTATAAVLSPADPASYVSSATGFVGRPAMVTQRCMSWGSDGTTPAGDAVWFDSPLPVGVKGVAGTVAETRNVDGQRVTVFSERSSLRRQILGTAKRVDVDGNGCPTQAVVRPTAGPVGLRPVSLAVCVYSQDTGTSTLMYSARLGASAARGYAARVGRPVAGGGLCGTPNVRWVALGLADGAGGAGVRWDVADLGCDQIQTAHGLAGLTPDTVRDWAVGGVPAYVGAPPGNAALAAYLRAPVG